MSIPDAHIILHYAYHQVYHSRNRVQRTEIKNTTLKLREYSLISGSI